MTRPLSPAEIAPLLTEFVARDLRTPDEVREAWCRALEAQGHRQCIGAWGPRDMVCAMILLGEIVHGPRENSRQYNAAAGTAKASGDMARYYDGLGAKAGLSPRQVGDVIVANDGWVDGMTGRRHSRRSFKQIAKQVRSWFA